MKTVYMSYERNNDGQAYLAVYSDAFGDEPLIGDYRGIELCRINYISSREDSILRAQQIAISVIAAEQKRGADFSQSRGNPLKMSMIGSGVLVGQT